MNKLSKDELEQIDLLDRQLLAYKKINDDRAFGSPIGGFMPMMEPPSRELVESATQLRAVLARANIAAPALEEFIGDPTSRVKDLIGELREIEEMNER